MSERNKLALYNNLIIVITCHVLLVDVNDSTLRLH